MINGTSYFFDRTRERMTGLSATAERLQEQVATGKKLIDPSQDAAGWQRLQRLVQAKSDAGAYAGNIALAQGVLGQTEGALATVQTQLQRANELAIKANSGILTTADRAAIATELDAIVEDLGGLADGSDTRGQPLFDATAAGIPVGDGVAVKVNSDRTAVFGTIIASLATYAGQLRTGTNSENVANSQVAIAALSAATANVAAQQGSVGARAARIDLLAASATDAALVVEAQRSAVEDADLTTTIADLQKTMTILSATQASFGKLTQLTLFDYLR